HLGHGAADLAGIAGQYIPAAQPGNGPRNHQAPEAEEHGCGADDGAGLPRGARSGRGGLRSVPGGRGAGRALWGPAGAREGMFQHAHVDSPSGSAATSAALALAGAAGRSGRRRRTLYISGTKKRVVGVASSRPPMTARPSGAFCSPPSPRPSAIGSMPMIIASAVMTTGRKGVGPAARAAPRGP